MFPFGWDDDIWQSTQLNLPTSAGRAFICHRSKKKGLMKIIHQAFK